VFPIGLDLLDRGFPVPSATKRELAENPLPAGDFSRPAKLTAES